MQTRFVLGIVRISAAIGCCRCGLLLIAYVAVSQQSACSSEPPDLANICDVKVAQVAVQLLPKSEVIEMGDFEPGALYRVQIDIQNNIGRRLSVVDVKTSCGCMRLDRGEPNSIASGEIGRVSFLFDAPTRPGKFQKELAIAFEGDGSNSLNLRMSGIVPSPIQVFGGPVSIDANGCGSFQFKFKPGEIFESVDISALRGAIESCVVDKGDDGKWNVSLQAPPNGFRVDSVVDILRFRCGKQGDVGGAETFFTFDYPISFVFPSRLAVFPSVVAVGSKGGRFVLTGFKGSVDEITFTEESGAASPEIIEARAISRGIVITLRPPDSHREMSQPLRYRLRSREGDEVDLTLRKSVGP